MAEREEGAYILGTHDEELYRLGLQHQAWAEEAQRGWQLGGFTAGHHLLDLGCGPGFCTKEMAFIAGPRGKVIGIDLSEKYIQHLNNVASLHGLNIEGITTDFSDMDLKPNSLDGAYCRWALAWHNDPKAVLQKVKNALKPGGKMVAQEYFQWNTAQTVPTIPVLKKALAACLQSLKDPPGDIDVGRQLTEIFSELDMKVCSVRLMPKIARPHDFAWNWQRTFYEVYFPELIKTGYLSQEDCEASITEFKKLESNPNAIVSCPLMVEVVAEK